MSGQSSHWFGNTWTKWQVMPIRQVARLGTGHTPSRANDDYWQNCTIPWVTVEDIRRHGEGSFAPLEDTEQFISELGLENSAAVLHPRGTVMLLRTASIGFSCITGRAMATTQAFVTWTPDERVICGDFLHAAIKAMADQYDYLAYGATHLTIYFPDIKTLRVPVPPLEDQRLIAAFLKRETTKIDALITEQERLIELLQEKRQAVISHAVTRGLNPDVTMKPSGLEWPSEVPATWNVAALKRSCDVITDGAHISPDAVGGAFPFISTKDIVDDGIDFDGCVLTSPATYEYMVRTGCRPERGDVLFSKDGTIGRTVVVRTNREFVVASSLIIIRPCAPQILDPGRTDPVAGPPPSRGMIVA